MSRGLSWSSRIFRICALGLAASACGADVPLVIRDEMTKTAQQKSGQATIVFFTDFQCPYCRRTHAALSAALESRPNRVRVALKHVPLPRHPDARTAARAAICVERLTPALLDDYSHALFGADDLSEVSCERMAVERGVDREKLQRCLQDPSTDARIDRDLATFDAVRGDGVPLLYVGRKRLEGMQPRVGLELALQEALKDAPPSTPPPVLPTAIAIAPATELKEALPFIHDDYPKALALAKQQNKPLFVDAWATWCHSCQSLRTNVLTDPSLAPLANDFVWLSIDTEKDVNGEWVKLHPHSALPTLWVIDPQTDRAVLKWAGTATATELKDLLTVSRDTKAPNEAATSGFVRGNRALASGDTTTAEHEFRTALAAASPQHPHRARIVEALVTHLSLTKQWAACADVAAKEAASLPVGTSRASSLVTAIGCTEHKDADVPAATLETLTTLALHDAQARDGSLLVDDRSAIYEALVDLKKDKLLATEWSEFLDREAAKALTKDARAALDPHRLSAYIARGEVARAVPMLEQSERDFPQDYNPPARLGRAFLEMNRLDDATRAVDRAAARVYGPRAMRVLALKADIAKARGDRAGEIAALEEALARSDKAVLTEGQKGVREGLVKRLAKLR